MPNKIRMSYLSWLAILHNSYVHSNQKHEKKFNKVLNVNTDAFKCEYRKRTNS